MAAAATSDSTPRSDEDLINRSLLDYLDEQADSVPPSSTDSDAPTYSSASGSSAGSPTAPFRMNGSRHAESAEEAANVLQHLPDSSLRLQTVFSNSHPLLSPHSMSAGLAMDHIHDHSAHPMPTNPSLDGFASSAFMSRSPPTASSFSHPRNLPSISSSFRDTTMGQSTNSLFSDGFPPRITSPRHAPTFDGRTSLDFAHSVPPKQTYGSVTEFGTGTGPTLSSFMSNGPKQFGSVTQPTMASSAQSAFTTMSSQTPYGPHVPAVPTAPVNRPNAAAQPVPEEEISTIFVVGFPDDMQEREFQNMFTFSVDFEAATLKIPAKEYPSYNAMSQRPGGNGMQSFQTGFGNPSDPFSVIQPGTGINETGRDGQWPSALVGMINEDALPFGSNGNGNNVPQRRQIIGFAKFRTRNAALEARDWLQGRRVDIEKGAVLKAEMAKKNLHTKRGVGPTGGVGSHTGPGSNMTSAAPSDGASGGDTQGPAGPNSMSWRDTVAGAVEREFGFGGDDRRQREALNSLALGVGQRGPRIRAEEHDQRRRQQSQLRLRTSQPNVYDAYNAAARQSSLMSPGASAHVLGHAEHGLFSAGSNNISQQSDDIVWDDVLRSSNTAISVSSQSSSSSTAGRAIADSHMQDTGTISDIAQATAVMSITTNGETSPQLPSPASGASSTPSTKNMIDQNPPINTLYVGNLPTTPPPTGFPQDHLECSLRDLFSAQPGFRRLCFRQKSNGPMCFVEFEDVHHATRALNDLYGHTLNGIVKGGGIRLSYSKNPLGVRTPTNATSNAASQTVGPIPPGLGEGYGLPSDLLSPRIHSDTDLARHTRLEAPPLSPPLPHHAPNLSSFMLSSPPAPRFAAPPTSLASHAANIYSLNGPQSASCGSSSIDAHATPRGVFAPFSTNGVLPERQPIRSAFDLNSRSSLATQHRTLPGMNHQVEAARAL